MGEIDEKAVKGHVEGRGFQAQGQQMQRRFKVQGICSKEIQEGLENPGEIYREGDI